MLMRPFYILFAVCLSFGTLNGQSVAEQPVVALPAVKEELTDEYLRILLQYQFSKFISGDAIAGIGNYASVSTGSDLLKLGATYVFNERKLITAEISAGAIEGVAGLLSDGRLNRNVSGKAFYHRLVRLGRKSQIKVDRAFLNHLDTEQAKIKQTFEQERLKNRHNLALSQARIALEAENVKLIQLKATHASLPAPADEPPIIAADKMKMAKKASAKYLVARSEQIITTLSNNISVLESDGYFGNQRAYIDSREEAALDKVRATVASQAIECLNFHWVTFGAGATNKEFSLYEPLDTTPNAIVRQNYNDISLYAAFSHYRNEPGRSGDVFWSIGLDYSRNSNIGSLKSLTLRSSTPISGDSTTVVVDEQKVLVGEYEEDLDRLRIFYDNYYFFSVGSQENIALHFGPDLLLRDGSKPHVNLTLGLLIPFLKEGSTQSVVNVETFIRLQNLFGTGAGSSSLKGKSVIGLSVSFPLPFLN